LANAVHSPQALPFAFGEWQMHSPKANAVCVQWQRLAFATGFADFNAEANGKHIRICRWQSRQMQRLGGF